MLKIPAFAQGAQVDHPKFGFGSVMSCNEDYVVIKFAGHGEKRFFLKMVLSILKKSDSQPPAEKRRSPKKKAASRRGATS
jgi:transcription elongation factor GreA-like protein